MTYSEFAPELLIAAALFSVALTTAGVLVLAIRAWREVRMYQATAIASIQGGNGGPDCVSGHSCRCPYCTGEWERDGSEPEAMGFR